MTALIIGVDPGKSLGVAIFRDTQLLYVFQGNVERGMRFITDALAEAREPGVTVDIACEQYILTPGGGRKTPQNDATLVIGGIQQLLTAYPDVTLSMQTSSAGRRVMPDYLMKRLGLFVLPRHVQQKDANDANSAIRHALLLMSRKHAQLYTTLLRDVPIVE